MIAEDLKDLLISFGLKYIRMAHTKDQALKLLDNELPDAALLDIRMEAELDGLEIAE